MFQWQLVVLFTLLLTTICISGTPDIENSKTCLGFTGSQYGDAKCAAYCIGRGRKTGSCIKKRCVCTGVKPGQDDDDDDNSQKKRRQLSIFT
jgi:hypothetical protein